MNESPVSDNPLTSKMENGSKHCSKMDDSTFTIFLDPCEGNLGLKSLSEWYAKCLDCLLNHILLITSILFLIETIYSKIFSHLSQKRKLFSQFLFAFLKFRLNLYHFQKKLTLIAWMYFLTYGLRKTWLDKFLKSPVSEDPFTSNMVNGAKDCSKLNGSFFTIFIDHSEDNSVCKSLS